MTFEPEGDVWIDGRMMPPAEATIRIVDPGIQGGLGVFETIAVREGIPLDLRDHLKRLVTSAARIGASLPESSVLDEALRRVAAAVRSDCGWLKVSQLRGGPCVVYAGRMDPAEEGRSVSAVLLDARQSPSDPLAGCKSWSYASRILALEEARRRGADDGIWLTTRGYLAESCTSSLFVIQRKRLFTPALRDGILPGITRAVALEVARALGTVIHEGKVRLVRLEKADEAFLTSSLRGVRPLVRFEGRPVGSGTAGPLTQRIATEVDRLRRQRGRRERILTQD